MAPIVRPRCSRVSLARRPWPFGANHHLRQSFVFLDMPAMQRPEAYIGNAPSLFDSQGALTNGKTREFIQKVVTGACGCAHLSMNLMSCSATARGASSGI
jgi:hypothetical protein